MFERSLTSLQAWCHYLKFPSLFFGANSCPRLLSASLLAIDTCRQNEPLESGTTCKEQPLSLDYNTYFTFQKLLHRIWLLSGFISIYEAA